MIYYESTFMLRTEVIMRAVAEGKDPGLPRVVDAIIVVEKESPEPNLVLCKDLMPEPFPLAIFDAIYEPTRLPSITHTH